MYSLTQSEREAELLWLHLQGRVYKAYCDEKYELARRLEALSERAFWRLIRRLDMSTRLRRGAHLRRQQLQRSFTHEIHS